MPADNEPVRITRGSARRLDGLLKGQVRDVTGQDGRGAHGRPAETIIVRLTAANGDNRAFSWEEVYLEDDGETWTTLPGGRAGTWNGSDPAPAYVAGTASAAVGDVPVVLRRANRKTDAGAWLPGWLIMRTELPPGTGRWKCLMLIDDLDPGTVAWDRPRFS